MLRNLILATAVLAGAVNSTFAQPPIPQPGPQIRIEGRWFFRGDPRKPCFIQSVNTPQGPMLLLTNENGTPSYGQMDWQGRVVAFNWNQTAYVRGNMLLWPNNDFWSR